MASHDPGQNPPRHLRPASALRHRPWPADQPRLRPAGCAIPNARPTDAPRRLRPRYPAETPNPCPLQPLDVHSYRNYLKPMEGASLVTRSGLAFGKIRRHHQTRRDKRIPVGGIRQRRNGDQFSLVQPRQRCIDHLARFHDHVRRDLACVNTGTLPDFGARHAWQHRLYFDPGAIQLGIQRLGQAQHISLAGTVSGVEALGEQRHHRGDVDDRTPAGFCKTGGRRRSQARDRRYVQLNQTFQLIQISVGQQAICRDTRVIQQQTDTRIAAKALLKFQHIILLREIRFQHLDLNTMLSAQLARRGLKTLFVTCNQQQIKTARCQALSVNGTNPG
ncbi:hypothetical protein EMIT0P44_160093 [Pseudomonas sp. IT-P44]